MASDLPRSGGGTPRLQDLLIQWGPPNETSDVTEGECASPLFGTQIIQTRPLDTLDGRCLEVQRRLWIEALRLEGSASLCTELAHCEQAGPWVLQQVVAHPACPAQTALEIVAANTGATLRRCALNNPQLPATAVALIAQDPSLREQALRHPNCPHHYRAIAAIKPDSLSLRSPQPPGDQ